MIIARLLGPEDYGIYSLALVLPTILAGLINFGMTSAITHFSAKLIAEGKKQNISKLIETSLLFELLVSLIASVFCFFFSEVLAKFLIGRAELNLQVRLASTLILLQTLFNLLASIFIGLNSMEINARMLIVSSLIKVILSPVLIVIGFGVTGAISGQVLYFTTAIVIGFIYLEKYKIVNFHWRIDSTTLKEIFKYSLPIYASSLLVLLFIQYQSMVLAFFTSNTEVGNFQVTTLFASAILILVFPFTSLFPSFTKVRSRLDDLQRMFSISVKYTAILVVPASLAIATLSKDLILTFFGSEFNLAPTFLMLYILTNLYAGLGSSVVTFLFSGVGNTTAVLKLDLINFVVFLPLAPLLTQLWGGVGLIFAIIIAKTAMSLYGLLIATKEVGVHPDMKSSIKIYVSSILTMIPLIIFLKLSPFQSFINLLISSVIFFGSYLTLLPVIGAVNKSDVETLQSIFRKNTTLTLILKPLFRFETMVINRFDKHESLNKDINQAI